MNLQRFNVRQDSMDKKAALAKWQKNDTTWTFGLFGTAIGAGVLFFPIRAGYGGWLPVAVMLILAYPIAFFCHRALARFCLAGKQINSDITQTVESYFGKTGSIIITFLYFLAICPLLWIYGVTLTNTFMAFWELQLGYEPLHRGAVALICLVSLAIIILLGKNLVIRIMSYLVFPFIVSLLLISLLLIPYWNLSSLSSIDLSNVSLLGERGLLVTVWFGIAIMVFSFNFSPVVSSFVISQRERYESAGGKLLTENKCSNIISRASVLMVFVVMFFSFSCLLALPPEEMVRAKTANVTILSYLADYIVKVKGSRSLSLFLEFSAPLIALVAVFKSFFGHYLGTLEGLNGLIIRFIYKGNREFVSVAKLNFISMTLIIGSTWLVAYLNPNILDMIEQIGAPIIACLLCFLPIYASYKLPVMNKYRGDFSNYFVLIIGVLTILNIIYKLV